MHNNIRDKQFIKQLGLGEASIETGWTRSLEENIAQLEQEIEGLEVRMDLGVSSGVPAAYAAKRVFTPESSTVLVDLSQDPGDPLVPMNYIVRDGATYDIPILMPGPGVFVAKHIVLAMYLKYFSDTANTYVQKNITGNQTYLASSIFFGNNAGLYTTKFSAQGPAGNQPFGRITLSGGNVVKKLPYVAINYFWNLLDSKSGVKLSDELMSQNVLLPRSRPYGQSFFGPKPQVLDGSIFNGYADGGFFEFDVPFVFERDGQANFLFRPITPFLQEADTLHPQEVIVQVEMHGFRYETAQDERLLGALSR